MVSNIVSILSTEDFYRPNVNLLDNPVIIGEEGLH